MNNPFHYRDNRLFCEDIDIAAFALKVPTPFYLYSQSEIEYNCDQVWQAAPQASFLPFYAVKANFNPAILKLILSKNFGADIVSGGEFFFSKKAGFNPDKMVFAGVGKTDEELEMAIKNDIYSINVESEAELLCIEKIAAKLNKIQRVAIRINPDIEAKTHIYITTGLHTSKFGVSAEEAFRLYMKTKNITHIKAEGIHVHIGSQITEESPFVETAGFLTAFIKRLTKSGIEIKYIDLGGGIGIDYENDFGNPARRRTYIKEILIKYIEAFKGLKVTFFAELGRSIIGSAGILVTKVILNKLTPAKKFVIIDAAMNNLIRPSLYQAKHPVIPLIKTDAGFIKADIVGPVCESGDFMAKDYPLPALKAGDCLAIGHAGAYGQALSSNYNLRPTICEYLVNGANVHCIFRGNSIEQLATHYEW
jgi:diaminopimelate decarboxylase